MSDSLWFHDLVACQAPLPMGFPRQEYWTRLPFPSSGDLPDPVVKTTSPALIGRFYTAEPQGKPNFRCTTYQFDIYIYCKMIITISLGNISHHTFTNFFFLWSEFLRSTLKNFKICNMLIILLTIVTTWKEKLGRKVMTNLDSILKSRDIT